MSTNFTKPGLDARLEGLVYFEASPDTVTQDEFYFSSKCILNGIQLYAWDSNKGDKISFYIEYWNGSDWVLYKKFGKSWFVIPNEQTTILLFPSEPSLGTRLIVKYSCGTNPVDVIINGFKFVDSETIKTSLGEQGTDW